MRTSPSGIKICEFINLSILESQSLWCVDRSFGESIYSVWSISLSVLDADPNKKNINQG